jgi:hypothetical protein
LRGCVGLREKAARKIHCTVTSTENLSASTPTFTHTSIDR